MLVLGNSKALSNPNATLFPQKGGKLKRRGRNSSGLAGKNIFGISQHGPTKINRFPVVRSSFGEVLEGLSEDADSGNGYEV